MGNRILKDTIRTSRNINTLSDFQFRVWVYLLTYVDDYGRGSADAELLKGLVFTRRKGITEQQISKALADLASSGMITLYEVDGESFFCFPNWDKHQRIQTKRSKFPAPPLETSPWATVSHRESPPESESESKSESESEPEGENDARPPAPTRAAGYYLDRVNPAASQRSLEELAGYEQSMGAEVCRRAMDIALDERKTSWAYIRAILRRWEGEGVKCIGDIEALEEQHQEQKRAQVAPPGRRYGKQVLTPEQEEEKNRKAMQDVDKDVAWMKEFLEKERRSEAEDDEE